jgi:hypothetical protein
MDHTRRNLVIATVGDDSQHPSWLAQRDDRSFDVALVYYGGQTNRYRGESDYYSERRGFKFPLISQMLDELGSELDRFDYVWLPDDDIRAATGDVNRLFQIARDYRLAIAQPGIESGDVSYRALRQQPNLLLRYTGFVEVMCPLFSRDALGAVRHTFAEVHSGWGIDWAWTRMVDRRQMAVVDGVGVRHTRPLATGSAYQELKRLGLSPTDECRQTMHRYGARGLAVRWHRRALKYGTVSCAAIDSQGRRLVVGPPWWKRLGKTA